MPTEDTVNIVTPGRSGPRTVPVGPTPPPTSVLGGRHVVELTPAAVAWVPGYEDEREIARGGMGVVLAARDPVLGRDVAIKLLLPESHSGDEARRFVQESKITARLPHPGIPPVYELGTLPDGNPFLAMKLVRGRTLAAELADAGRAADLPRLIDVFEQVAQAVGFAHSQGVIHRDLKPSNVMVGAFGEVQVMDWGLAKEIDAPDEPRALAARQVGDDPVRTEAGVALGTPAYIAPEQARGERLGPPADVFALGGILCDILTGHPPFEGNTVHDTILKAALGDVASAFERLDACAADPELVALCKRLLSPLVKDRPADGKAVAGAVAAYRAGVERRLRDAETERAAADVRAVEQRKKRRVQAALATAVAALVGLAGLGAWWQDRQAADRRFNEERQQQAEHERLARNAAAFDGLLLQGEERLRQGDADRAEELLAQAEGRLPDGGGDAERLARLRGELAVLRTLARAHDLMWTVVGGKGPSAARLTAAWAEAFRPFGLVPGAPVPGGFVDHVRGATIREHLLGALENWYWTEPSAEVLAVLRAADPDGYRNDARAARQAEDMARLRELAADPAALRQPARFALLFALSSAVPQARRDEVLQGLHRRQPGDFNVLMDLAALRPGDKRDRTAERVGWYRAALAVRPRGLAAWNNLGNALHDLGRYADAVAAYREAVRHDPTYATAYSNLGGTLRVAKDLPGALAAFREALRLDPIHAHAHNNLALARQDAGDLPGALAAFREAIRLDPTDAVVYSNMASALSAAGDPRAAVAACREAVRLAPDDAGFHSNLGAGLREAGDLDGAVAACQEAIRTDPRYAPGHFNLGSALLDRGDPPGAVAAYREAVRVDPSFAKAHSLLGHALRAAGDLPAALVAGREAVRLDPELPHAHHHLGLALRAAGDLPAAVAAQREAVRLNPKFAAAHSSLGLALKARGDLPGALAALRDAVRADPKYAPAHNNLGLVLKATGDLPGAVAAYKEAIRLRPKDLAANYNLGLALAAQNDLPGAVAAFREVTRINPRHAGGHAALGEALLASGDADAGRAAFAEAARLDPKQFGPAFRERFPPAVAPPPREVRPPGPG